MRELDCGNVESTYLSLQRFLDVNSKVVDEIINRFIHAITIDISFPNIGNILEEYALTIPEENIVYFYHFTKSLNPSKFETGLYPLNMIGEKLLKDLYLLVDDKCTENEWSSYIESFRNLRDCRYTSVVRFRESDDGPNGFLIKEFGLSRQSNDVYYLENSEFIDDFISFMGSVGLYIHEKFHAISRSCIVKFMVHNLTMEQLLSYIKEAFGYLAFKKTRKSIDYCNSAYWNCGVPISSSDIILVELLD